MAPVSVGQVKAWLLGKAFGYSRLALGRGLDGRSEDFNVNTTVTSTCRRTMARRFGNIKLNEAAFFLCDMQERFRTAIKYFSEILEVSQRLVCSHFFAI